MPGQDRLSRVAGVDRLEPGDHAFLGYRDDEARWDERLFGGTDAFRAGRSVHPAFVLARPGGLHTAVSGQGIALSGDSDFATRASFDQALRLLAGQSSPTLALDLTDRSFFDAYRAGAVLRLAAELVPPRRLEVHCQDAQRRMLQLLGSRSVSQLLLVTTRL